MKINADEQVKYFTKEFMKPIFDILDKCEGIKQDPKWHPEFDLLNHSLQTFNYAIRETNDIDVLLAALLHDVGKINIRLGHDSESVKMLEGLISHKTAWLIENHMRIWSYVLGQMMRLKKCKELIEHPWFYQLVQLARFDKLGRRKSYFPKYDKDVIIDKLNKAYDEHWQGEEPYSIKNIKVETSSVLSDLQIVALNKRNNEAVILEGIKNDKAR